MKRKTFKCWYSNQRVQVQIEGDDVFILRKDNGKYTCGTRLLIAEARRMAQFILDNTEVADAGE